MGRTRVGDFQVDDPDDLGRLPVSIFGPGNGNDPGNAQEGLLAAGATFTGEWTDVSQLGSFYILYLTLAAEPPASVQIQFSDDGINPSAGSFGTINVTPVEAGPFLAYLFIPVAMSGKYYRLKVVNGATPQTLCLSEAWLFNNTFPGKWLTFTQNPEVFDQMLLVRSVQTGKDPDGLYKNAALGGTKTLTPTPAPLGVSGVYESQWIDCEDYPTVRLLVATDQRSEGNGIIFEWSDDELGTVVRSRQYENFLDGNITEGKIAFVSTRARYLRVRYINGGVAQGRFFLNLRLNPTPLSREVTLVPTSAGRTGQMTVDTNPLEALQTALPGRKSCRLKNMSSSARSLFYGFTSAVTAVNGDELAAGEAVDLDIDEFTRVWVVTTSTAGAGVRCSWTEIA